jgi:TrmH family RNA methyltransferase
MAGAATDDGQLRASNHRLKRIRRLLSSRRARFEERAFVVEGPSMVAEALAAASAGGGLRIEALFLEPGASPVLASQADALGVAVHAVAPGVLKVVLDTVNPQPVAVVASRDPAVLGDLGRTGTVLCLVEARDPGNVGTLIRTAEASGAVGVVLAGSSVDPTNPKALRASAGAGLRLPIVVAPETDLALAELASSRTMAATVVEPGGVPYDQVSLADAAIVLGNETHGLPAAVVARADLAVTIPFAGPTESLNVAAAGAVLCFEALRQRRAAAGSAADTRTGTENPLDTPRRTRQVWC